MKTVEGGPVGSPSELNRTLKKVLHSLEDRVSFFQHNPLATKFHSYAKLSLVGLIAFGSVALEKVSAQTPDLPVTPSSEAADTIMEHSALSEEFTTVLPEPNTDGGGGSGCVLPTPPQGVEFKLGFKALADLNPCVVGAPLENEHWGANGDSLQITTNGLMAWRKADNWTAFTNGARTWINGPEGLQDRENAVRFTWEAPIKPQEVQTIPPVSQASPTPSAIDRSGVGVMPETGIERIPPPMGETLRNFFTDTFVKVNRRNFSANEIVVIDGIEIKGQELIDKDYAKRVIAIIRKVPEYYDLLKKTIKSLEMYNDQGGNGNIAVNDVLGDGGHSLPSRDKILNDFGCASTAVELVYDAKLTELAVNGNLAGRSFKRAPQGSDMEKEQQIRWNKAQLAASETALSFATKANVPVGIRAWYEGNVERNRSVLKNLQQN